MQYEGKSWLILCDYFCCTDLSWLNPMLWWPIAELLWPDQAESLRQKCRLVTFTAGAYGPGRSYEQISRFRFSQWELENGEDLDGFRSGDFGTLASLLEGYCREYQVTDPSDWRRQVLKRLYSLGREAQIRELREEFPEATSIQCDGDGISTN